MRVIDEDKAFRLATPERAFEAVRAALIAAAEGTGVNNPVAIGAGAKPGQTFSIKSGSASSRALIGVKIGSFWPENDEQGLPRHSSLVVLLDAETGRAKAVIAGGRMNGRRTAAADAIAVDALARRDSKTLAILGAGAQAAYEVEALARVRTFETILVASRNPARAEMAARTFAAFAPVSRAVGVREACEAADVLVTATPARQPLFEAGWIRPGTHVSAMGADQAGKQELPDDLVGRARRFADDPDQSRRMGEFQRLDSGAPIIAIGDVLRGAASGRTADKEITIFDSSGLALQDLFVAAEVLDAA